MPLTHLLDTSVLSQPIKDHPIEPILDRWSELGDRSICTSAICLAELKQGLEIRQSGKYWRRYRELLEGRYRILPFDESTADVFAQLVAEGRRNETPKPTIDLMIAATAKQHGLIVATLNGKDFSDIPGVAVEDWGC